jgi:hypothetical protein
MVACLGTTKTSKTAKACAPLFFAVLVYTMTPNQPEVELECLDAAPPAGGACYCVRVIQSDGEMAWGSPTWVRYER